MIPCTFAGFHSLRIYGKIPSQNKAANMNSMFRLDAIPKDWLRLHDIEFFPFRQDVGFLFSIFHLLVFLFCATCTPGLFIFLLPRKKGNLDFLPSVLHTVIQCYKVGVCGLFSGKHPLKT